MTQTKLKLLRRLLVTPSAVLIVTSAWAQVAPDAKRPDPVAPQAASPEKKIPIEKAATPAAAAEEETIMLSPFEVVSDTKGYYSANTMSGTRFNAKLEDLASSISVMTKEQMSDFGMLDINDVFLYTGNAEGTGTYTDYSIDRNGQLTDNVQLNPAGANRIRGIGAANISYGNFEISNRMPIDPSVIEGVEISRGPNANVFGLGNAAGTVNQVPISANLTRNKTKIEVRADSYEGWRTAFDSNVVLKKNVLSIRVGASYQREEFERKPSGVDSTRYNAMIKYQPFKYTTISGSYLHYRMEGNRPNFTPPRDNASYWLASGRPSWNPTTQHYTRNGLEYGVTGGVVVAGGTGVITDALLPDFFVRPASMNSRANLYIDQNGVAYWTAPANNTAATPAANAGQIRYLLSNPGMGVAAATSGRTNQPLFSTTPTVSDKSLYDWSSINLSSVNRLRDETDMYLGQIDQVIINTQMHTLAVQAAALREDSERYQRTPIGNSGNSGASGQLFMDVNEYNLDGTRNPFFGRPFIGVTEPRTTESPQTWDTYRGQASYRIDLSQEKNALKWLGTHQISGYYEYKYRINRAVTYRDVMTSDHTWTATGQTGFAANQARGNQSNVTGGPQAGANIVRGFMRYYVGDTSGNVDYAPADYSYGNYPFVWGTTGNWRSETASLGLLSSTDGAGGAANVKQTIKTNGVVIQSQFLDGKIVGTLGFREDSVYSKSGLTPTQLTNGNRDYDFENNNHWAVGDYRANSGKTKTAGVVVRPLRDIPIISRNAEQNTGAARFFAQTARGMSLTYNKSDTFLPVAPAIDLFQNNLPNVTGEGEDYGVRFNLLDSKLIIGVNRYENTQLNARNGDANTIAQRVLRMDLNVPVNDVYQLYDQVTAWVTAQNPGFNIAQVQAEVARQTGVPTATNDALSAAFTAGTIAATNDITAKGTELEIYYNPSRYWTIVASAEEKTSVNSKISDSVQKWIDQRYTTWTTIQDPRGPDRLLGTVDDANVSWWTTNYGGTQSASQNYDVFVKAPYSLLKQQEGKSLPSVRRYAARASTSYQLAGITDNNILKKFKVGGAVRWEDKAAIGYLGKTPPTTGPQTGIYQELDSDKPVYDEAHWYFDAFVSYRMKMWNDKVIANFQLNCRNIQEDGRLQPIGVFPDGTVHSYRIVDPRIFMLTATFEL